MGSGRRAVLGLSVLVAAPAIWLGDLVRAPTAFPFLVGTAYSDLVVTHFPSAWFIHESVVRWHQIPLWNPNILSGMPLAADPLAALWYPPAWLTMLVPTAGMFNLYLYAHLVLAGLGMAAFTTRLGVMRGASVFCGLAFGGLVKLVGHIGLGHVGMVAAVSWLPCFLLAVEHGALSREVRRSRHGYGLAAAAFALLLVADPRWALPAGALGLAWWLYRVLPSRRTDPAGLRTHLELAAGAGAVAFLLCAPLLLPMLELVQLSSRASLEPAEAATLSLPPIRLLTLLTPEAAGTPEWQVYVGLTVLFLAGVAVVLMHPGWTFWAGEAAVALLWSLGSHTPVYSLLSRILPGALELRVPARLLFAMAFGVIVLAGLGLTGLVQRMPPAGALRSIRLWGFGLMAGAIAAAIGVASLTGGGIAWMTLAVALVIGIGGQAIGRSARLGGWLVAVACLLQLLDLAGFNLHQLEARPSSAVLADGAAAVEAVQRLAGPDGRGFSPSYSLPQQTAATLALGLADGVQPLQLAAYRDFMASATGFDPDPYSVTLPPFPTGDPEHDWAPQVDLERLGLLSVGGMASAYPLAGLPEPERAGDQYLYSNPAARPRAWVEAETDAPDAWLPVETWDWTPNAIRVVAAGPGRVVLSEIAYPGWTLSVDGSPAVLEVAHDILRSAAIEPGAHELRFVFFPRTVVLGMIAGLGGLILLAGMGWRR
jgi:hypothetical protein